MPTVGVMHTITSRSRLAALRGARPLARAVAPHEAVIDRIRGAIDKLIRRAVAAGSRP